MTASEIIQRIEAQRNEQQRQVLMRFFKTGNGDYGEGDEFLGKDCASCQAASSGKYSKLGDTGKFWSTSAGPSDFDPNWIVDFKSGHIEGVFPNDDFDDGRFNYFVRCVRNAD